jgi:AraC-like DNA-binding protein
MTHPVRRERVARFRAFVNDWSQSAMVLDVDSVRLSAFALSEDHRPFDSREHSHRKHQLLYAESGTLQLVTEGGSWFLPPARAALIRARTRHRVRARDAVSLRTVYLAERWPVPSEGPVSVFAVPAVLREMILHAMRFGPDRGRDPRAERFFAALVDLLGECAQDPRAYRLPTARSPELLRAMEILLERLDAPPKLSELARRVGASQRTLERRFDEETAMGARTFLRTARVLRAMELLARPRATVTEVAFAVGFQSLSSFSRAFEEIAGERPRSYRRAVR